MVEICLRALSALDTSPYKDAYVSVRVGEMQKFSKLGATRSYKFPASAAKDRRCGRVELFQRLGTCTVALDRCTDEVQEVYLPTAAGDCRFSVEVGGTSDVSEAAAGQKRRTVIDEANSYLDKHFLEARLAQAMQAILRDRPEDPITFLTAHLTASAGQHASISKDMSPLANAEIPNTEGVAASPQRAPPQVVPFRTYYNAHMNTRQHLLGGIHAKFQPSAKPPLDVEQDEPSVVAMQGCQSDMPDADSTSTERHSEDAETGPESSDQPEQCDICEEPFEPGAPYFSHATDKSKGLCASCMEGLMARRPTNCSVCEVEFIPGCPIFGSESNPLRFLCQDCVGLVPGGPLTAIAENLDEDAASTHIAENLMDDGNGNLEGDLASRAATRDAAAIRHHELVEGGASPNAAAVLVIHEHVSTTALRGY